MPVVEGKSNLVPRALGGDGTPSPQAVSGRPKVITGTVATVAADDLNTSTYALCSLPSDCYLLPDTFFDVENWPFAAVRIGTATDVDALVSVAQSAGNIASPVTQGDGNHGLELWEILGLAENPGGFIDIYAHAIADATGAGEMPFQFHIVHRS